MQTFTFSTLGVDREHKIMELVHTDDRLTFAGAACDILSKEFGTQYVCYGGTPVMPIAEFRPLI